MNNTTRQIYLLSAIVIFFSYLHLSHCQIGAGEGDFSGDINNPAVLPYLTQVIYSRLSNATSSVLSSEISRQFKFCIKDPEADWDRAFNFSSNLDFLTSCIQKTQGDITKRLCTAADLKFYFNHFFESGNVDYLKPNNNCNLTNWGAGCEPGWASSVGLDRDVDLGDSKDIPARTSDPQPCCEGFFCPRGMTCMIPCPLGSYCPLATLNKDNGVCQPYNYQLPPAQKNHTCGGANIWADIRMSRDLFCSGGTYCPTSTQETSCSKGHYCRMGSTSEKRCFKLTSCGPNTENQNIHAYGILLIAALSTLLLIMYNCSDQVLTTRERRLAKSRERAAKSVHEKVKARERWKSAKEAAKKHTSGLQAQISRKFSRIKSVKHPEHSRIEVDDDQSLVQHHTTASASQQRDVVFDGKKMNPSDIVKMIHALEDDPNSFSLESTGYHDMKKKVPKDKQVQTHSQIFNYAYSQLEKEKAIQQQNNNMTFSGLINMATNTETIKRPKIEISFRDLTLTLKGTSKQILRCVTGKIMPGRITAFMGPSGAGKTTYLSALAGKAVGCTITGSIHINGKAASIHSYKKITGFVPQDDVVHGNLTVEENIWFSASCRLSADLPKPDKVLIVERVIESLGLQEVRNSVVGTVEKRGISGGQRKRVNVGLEMVMEPSLLILDEPTSGLDSSSSQLLLRALRREALEGVNICMVVHQPSYTLFNMFDDLVLLAKGGLTVYHGPVRRVEEYFSDIGIVVPDRVNPPDYFIDVLEGIVKPNSGVSYKELPVRWMLHNDYPVPPDMQQTSLELAMLAPGSDLGNRIELADNLTIEHSFAGEMWQDVKYNVELQRDILRHNLLSSKDLSNRKTPGILLQYKYFLGRVGKQRLREARLQAIDYLILLLAGACLGSISKFSDETFGAPGYTYTIIAVSLLCKIAALRSFSLDKLQYARESAAGISSLAHFLAKDTIDHFNTVIKPVVYLSMYYFFSNPRSSFADNYVVLLCLVYCVTGMAYILAIFLEPGSSQLLSVLLPVVLTLVSTQTRTTEFVKTLANLCYPKWALEAFVIANAERYDGVWLITRCGALQRTGYNLNHWGLRISLLILAGVISRIIAFVGLVTFRKK